MKKLLLALFCCFAVGAYAQDTVKKSNSVGKFDEQFMVLKSDKKVRQGSYHLYTEKKLVASGNYDKGKRVGVWSFYNGDELEQQYDYTSNKVVLNHGSKAISCEVENTQPSDSVKAAVKIGGYNGLSMLVASTDFSSNADVGNNKVIHVFTLDDKGEVQSWMATIKSADGIKVVNQKIVDVDPEVVKFIPAMVNGKPVACTVTFNSDMKGIKGAGTDGTDTGKAKTRGSGFGGRRGGE
ncbi:hypothetical protein HQ865_07810 [Mucilaginibacter mali]|uniref:DUF4412 domain-containing protein n=1 Tax=Mucilaginibacter mali TaxID=2740462 RepID=A0A7D4UJV7_9SPHI|nr:hypothetical protein [Mucilaginibacter mali]QKJ29662.1 hypothetical protein HQ865_07810 [Mucilaginibacter mali]